MSRRAAELAERRADALAHAPKLNDALGKGKVGAEHGDAVANAAGRLDDDSGMHLLFAKLTSEQGNRIRRALDTEIAVLAKRSEFAGLRHDQLMARALDRLVSPRARPAAWGLLRSRC